MKLFIRKKALTLVELVISITISGTVMLIVLIFVSDSIETVLGSNKKTEIFDDLFTFKDVYGRYVNGGYFDQSLIVSNVSGVGNDSILLRNADASQGVLFGVVDKATMNIERIVDYSYYKDKVIGYRVVSTSELALLESDVENIYDFKFFPDKLFDGLKIKDFQIEEYNGGEVFDINMEILLYYSDENNGSLLRNVTPEDTLDINLVY